MKLNGVARTGQFAAGAALVLLGLAHVGFTPLFYPLSSFAALWFVGAGLMALFAGVLTLVATRPRPDLLLLWATFLVDLLGTAHTFWVTRLLRQTQAWVGLAAFALAALCALVRALQAPRRPA